MVVSCPSCSSCRRASQLGVKTLARPVALAGSSAASALPRFPRGRATFSHSTSTSSPVSPFSSLNCAAAAEWPPPSQRSAAASRTIARSNGPANSGGRALLASRNSDAGGGASSAVCPNAWKHCRQPNARAILLSSGQ
eukprot:scaffold39007_cov58-Phaeocystis_antarctica.AAC.4